MGAEDINPHSLSKTSNWGQSTLLLQTSEHSHSLTPSAAKSVKCTLTPILKCVSLRLLFLPTSSHCESFIYRIV